jgi:hypothetical protein
MEKMTNTNKLIIGAVVVLAAFYLYDRNKKMKAAAELKAQKDAEELSIAQKVEDKKLATKRPLNQMNNSLLAGEEII